MLHNVHITGINALLDYEYRPIDAIVYDTIPELKPQDNFMTINRIARKSLFDHLWQRKQHPTCSHK